MRYVAILVYFSIGAAACFGCVRFSERCGVDSTFSRSGLSQLVDSFAMAPLVAIVVIPIAIAFWPLLCLMDLAEIPQKKNAKQQPTKSAIAETALGQSNFEQEQSLRDLIGQVGETIGVLSPMGKVRIDGNSWDAASLDGYVAAGQRIEVAGVRAKTLQVRKDTSAGPQIG